MTYLNQLNLHQTISTATRITTSSESLINLCIVDSPNAIMDSGTLDIALSDHLLCHTVLKWKHNSPVDPTTIYHRSLKHFDHAAFRQDLVSAPWGILDLFEDPLDKTEAFNLLLLDIINHHAPLTKVVIKKRTTPWIIPQLKKTMTYRNRLHRNFLKSRSETDHLVFCQFRNQVVHQQRLAKKQYVTSLIMKRATPSSIWSAIKLCMNNGSNYSTTSNANHPSPSDFSSYFTTVASIASDIVTLTASATTFATPPPVNYCELPLISTSTCESLITSLKPKKSSGTDQVSAIYLKSAPDILSQPIYRKLSILQLQREHFPISGNRP